MICALECIGESWGIFPDIRLTSFLSFNYGSRVLDICSGICLASVDICSEMSFVLLSGMYSFVLAFVLPSSMACVLTRSNICGDVFCHLSLVISSEQSRRLRFALILLLTQILKI